MGTIVTTPYTEGLRVNRARAFNLEFISQLKQAPRPGHEVSTTLDSAKIFRSSIVPTILVVPIVGASSISQERGLEAG